MQDLKELIARVEGASGPDRGLDVYVAQAVDKPTTLLNGQTFDQAVAGFPNDLDGIARHWPVLAYTASLDAAISLLERVLPGATWAVFGADAAFDMPLCEASVADAESFDSTKALAPTPALALVLAILKALDARENQ
jgi:hypothetical protein